MWPLFPLFHLHDLLLHRSAPILTSAAIYELFMNIFTSRQHFFTNAAVIKLDLMATYFFGFLSFCQVLLTFWRTLGRWWAFNGFCGNFGWNGNGGCSLCAAPVESLLCFSSEWAALSWDAVFVHFEFLYLLLVLFMVASVHLIWMGRAWLRCFQKLSLCKIEAAAQTVF